MIEWLLDRRSNYEIILPAAVEGATPENHFPTPGQRRNMGARESRMIIIDSSFLTGVAPVITSVSVLSGRCGVSGNAGRTGH